MCSSNIIFQEGISVHNRYQFSRSSFFRLSNKYGFSLKQFLFLHRTVGNFQESNPFRTDFSANIGLGGGFRKMPQKENNPLVVNYCVLGLSRSTFTSWCCPILNITVIFLFINWQEAFNAHFCKQAMVHFEKSTLPKVLNLVSPDSHPMQYTSADLDTHLICS